MLKIIIKDREMFNEETNEFYYVKAQTLQLEHSLISISKWESKWHKPFIPVSKRENHSPEEIIDYIKCMTLTPNVPDEVYAALTDENMREISAYMDDSMTASTVQSLGGKRFGGQVITSELVYYWMVEFHIPFECEKWHFNRLMMLIKICNAKKQPPKKMSKGAIISRNRALNEARRAQLNSKG